MMAKHICNIEMVYMCVKILGQILMIMGNFDKASHSFELLRNIAGEMDQPSRIHEAYTLLAKSL